MKKEILTRPDISKLKGRKNTTIYLTPSAYWCMTGQFVDECRKRNIKIEIAV